MPELFKDRVLESTTTTGTGTLTLAGAVTGYQTFAAVGNGNTCFYSVWDVDANGNPDGDWEVGIGTYTSSGTTLSRDTILASSNGGSAVNFAAGTKRVGCVHPAAKSSLPDVQIFTADGTWTKPRGARWVEVTLVGGGGGGGSGRRGAAGTVRCGGGGGAGAMFVRKSFGADQLGATETVTVGAGGAGGAAVSVNDTDGNNGVTGTNTQFGSHVKAVGGFRGAGGTATSGTGGVANYEGHDVIQSTWGFDGTAGGNASATGGVGNDGDPQKSSGGTGGGGAGGGITSGNSVSNGGAGATIFAKAFGVSNVAGGAAGTTPGGNGGAGNTWKIHGTTTGAGGGGGAGSTTGVGGTGGVGGNYGAGGGGGGASLNGNNSGAGGAGAGGVCVVVSW